VELGPAYVIQAHNSVFSVPFSIPVEPGADAPPRRRFPDAKLRARGARSLTPQRNAKGDPRHGLLTRALLPPRRARSEAQADGKWHIGILQFVSDLDLYMNRHIIKGGATPTFSGGALLL